MGENFQSGQHLDADQLNAFMEHALPEPERARTLAHLAVCADCRRVVSLASDAAEEELSPAPAVVAPAARPWWKMPVWQWSVPLAAVVVLAVVTLHRPKTNGAPPVEMAAKVASPPPVAPAMNAPAAPAPAPPKPAAANQMTAAKPAPAPSLIEPKAIGNLPMIGRDTATMAAPPPSVPAPVSVAGMASPQAGTSAPRSAVVLGSASVSSPAPMAPPPPAPPRPQMQSAGEQTDASLDALAAEPLIEHPLPPLPSGLPVVSTVTGAGQNSSQMLALDSAHTLFLTTDGAHWTKVKEQWSGRAVKVSLVGQATSGAGLAVAPRDIFHAYAAAAPAVAAAPARAAAERPAGSSVTGVVTDPTGALIPGATVTLTNASTKAVAGKTTTDKNGRYTIAAAPGNYVLDAQRPGFRQDQATITIPERTAFNQNLGLTVGAESTVVEVISSNADLQTLNATVGDTVSAQQIASLPKAKKLQAEPVFELTTDAGERWVSVDGKKWVKR